MLRIVTTILMFTVAISSWNAQADILFNKSVLDELQLSLGDKSCDSECKFNLHSLDSDEATLKKLKIDINSDGKADFVLSSRENCGAGTCIVALLVSDDNDLRNVFEGQNIAYFSQSTNGFRDLVQGKRGPGQPSYGGTGEIPIYRWNGERYIESGSIDDQTSKVTSIHADLSAAPQKQDISEPRIVNSTAKFLSFPLAYSKGAYTQKMITSVLDHYMDSPYGTDGVVLSFTGEEGKGMPKRQGCYQKTDGGTFSVLGLYKGTNDGCLSHQGLNYDNHPGYDYIAEIGTEVIAAASGTVVNVLNIRENSPEYQQNNICIPKGIDRDGCSAWGFVGIDHGNGYVTQYGHLSKINAYAGEYVEEGKIIGLTGQTSPPYTDLNGVWHRYSVGPHLHFEVLKMSPDAPYGYTFVDPYGWEGAPKEDYLAGVTGVQNIILWKDTGSVDTKPNIQPASAKSEIYPIVDTAKEAPEKSCQQQLNYSSGVTGASAQSALSKYAFDQGECQ